MVPQLHQYNVAMKALSAGGQWQSVVDVLRQMVAAAVRPDVVSYTTAVKACGDNGQWQQASTLTITRALSNKFSVSRDPEIYQNVPHFSENNG